MIPKDRLELQMAHLRQRFRARCPERSQQLLTACETGDLEAIRALAHDVTGSAGLFGFPALSDKAKQLSACARSQKDVDTFAAARELSAALLAVAAEED